MKAILLRGIAALIVLTAAVFVVDLVWLQIRIGHNPNSAFDSVQVDLVDVVPLKGSKAEYLPQGIEAQTCVRSLFPHKGDQPCWYLRRHAQQQVNF